MKIFQNKLPKTWKSTGIKFINEQMEMSNFSFAEDVFISTTNKFIINIIGKNIIGNGLCSITIHKDQFIVWQEELSFKGVSFSKKTIEIEEESDKEFRVVLSRGRTAKGNIIISSVIIGQVSNLKIEDIKEPLNIQQEDEPTFIKPISLKENTLEQTDHLKDDIKDIGVKKVTKKRQEKKKTAAKKKQPKKQKIPSPKKKKVEANKALDDYSASTIKETLNEIIEEAVVEKEPQPLVIVEEKKKNNIWIHIIDFSTIEDERDVFKYINQISFGKDKQVFLIKKGDNVDIDLSKYDYLNIFDNNFDLELKLIELNPEKLTFSEKNLNQDLLFAVNNFKNKQ